MGENRSVFQFKHFQLAHGNPGLKITTEACLFGAWAQQFAQGNVLDIGTGCGLLACMVAQENPNCEITAIEIQSALAMLAQENIQKLAYKITIENKAIQGYSGTFNFILCNPPFFIDHLNNPNASKQLAMHTDALSPLDLARGISANISPEGQFAVLYPPVGMQKFSKEAESLGLYLNEIVEVKHQMNRNTFRLMARGSRTKSEINTKSIAIKKTDQSYTAEFIELLRPYYLIFD
jgi:tRNA1Val (adenine37-N6)-methyltransferase